MLSIKELSVAYQVDPVLAGINLELAAGESCALIGPSGCGKSTLLKVLAGLISEFSGTVAFNGEPVSPRRQTIGFIPQNYGLLPWRTVRQNILLGVRQKVGFAAVPQETYRALLAQLGLSDLTERYPAQLSGGQQQRVALARAFLLNPDLLLMDEPFSALDAMTREEIQTVFLAAWHKRPVTTLLVTHHVEEAVYLGKKLVVLAAAPGRIHKVIDNPLFGLSNIRVKPEFFELCLHLRSILKEG